MNSFGSVVTAVVTPFEADLNVDYDRAAELTDRLLNTGSEAVLVGGTTGESPTLTTDEKCQLFKVTKEAAAGRGPVIAGTGSYCTAESIALTRKAESLGMDAVMLVCPYYNKPPQEGLYQHFASVAATTSLPVVIYNIPGRTGRNIEPATILRLAEIPNIVAVKEASGDVNQFARICAGTPPDFMVYSGDDSMAFHVVALGGCGVISVASHVAGLPLRELCTALAVGDLTKARELHLRLLPLFDVLFLPTSVNPAPVKAALSLTGFEVGGLRLPLVPVTEAEREKMRTVLERLELA